MNAPIHHAPARAWWTVPLLPLAMIFVLLGAPPSMAVDEAHITGVVTGTGGVPLGGIEVSVYDADDGWVGWATTEADGSYDAGSLPAGNLRVAFDDWEGIYAGEYYDDAPDFDSATPIPVAEDATVPGINATLSRGASISGVVTGAGEGPLEGINVTVYQKEPGSSFFDWVDGTTTGPDGAYTLTGLSTGTYRVGFEDFNGEHAPEYWDDAADLGSADDIVLTAEQEVTGKDAVLTTPGQITGTVSAPGGAPLGDVSVTAYQLDDDFYDSVSFATTEPDGSYTLSGLGTGTYRVGFEDESGAHLPEYWDDAPSVEEADDIPVTAGEVTSGKDATLATPGRITGRVTGPGGVNLPGIKVTVHQESDGFFDNVDQVTTAADGTYAVEGLTPGTYRLQFTDPSGTYTPEYWDNTDSLDTATDIPVAASATVSGRDAQLSAASHLTGTVRNPAGAGLPGITVRLYAYDDGWSPEKSVVTTATGAYDVGGLAPGTYRLGFVDGSGAYSSEFFDDVTLLRRARNIGVGESVTVSGKDVELTKVGSIAGTVSAASGPLVGIQVRAYELVDGDWQLARSTTSSATGAYSLTNLRATIHRIEFADPTGAHVGEWWDNAPDRTGATNIVVPADGIAAGKDAVLTVASHITGQVTNGSGNLAGATVSAYQLVGSTWERVKTATTNASGVYDLNGLRAGTYRVGFAHPLHLEEFWDDKPTLQTAQDVTVAESATAPGVNASLTSRGTISGKVTDATGAALTGIRVDAYRQTGSQFTFASQVSTGADGSYQLSGLVPATYRIELSDPNDVHAGEYWDNAASLATATDIPVAAAQAVTGRDAQLAAAGKIMGTVTGGGSGLESDVSLYRFVDGQWRFEDSTWSDEAGAYELPGLAAGDYRVEFEPWSDDFVSEFWDDEATLDAATTINVAPGATVGNIDAGLAAAGRITGTVTGPDDQPVEDVDVTAYREVSPGNWSQVSFDFTGADGKYSLGGLREGSYRVEFWPGASLQTEYWDDATTLASAQDVIVASGGTTANINAKLASTAQVAGRVTDAAGDALPGITVSAYQQFGTSWELMELDDTNARGRYVIDGLEAGDYRLRFEDDEGAYGREYSGDSTSLHEATSFPLTAGQSLPGKDATLAPAGVIPGDVTNVADAPIDAFLTVYQEVGGQFVVVDSVSTRDDGSYRVDGLAPDTYRIGFSASAHLPEFWDDAPTLAAATDIVVPAGTRVADRDAVLARPGTLTGTVTGPSGPAGSIAVTAYRQVGATWTAAATAITAANGTYTIGNLQPATYRLGFSDPSGALAPEFWDNVQTLNGATNITVTSGETITRNAQLAASTLPAVVNTSPPTITGTPAVGSELTASPGTWDPATGLSFAYQWFAGDSPINGVTGQKYTPTGADVGKTIRVRVVASKAGHVNGTATSAPTAAVAAEPPPAVVNTAPPTITGTPQVGAPLTAGPGTWNPEDITPAYQWLVGGTAVPGATGSTYTPVAGDVGKAVTVRVTASRSGFDAASATSAPTAAVAPGTITNTKLPAISGIAKVGKTLKVSKGTWTPAVTLKYQWLANGKVIKKATRTQLKLTKALKGKTITVKVTAQAPGYTRRTVTTKPTKKVR